MLARDPAGLELHADPTALAPERLLVFELRGPVDAFAAAVRKVPGLELVDEEELVADHADKAPLAYLMVPDVRALRELESLWRRWVDDKLPRGFGPWRDVFTLLRDLRPWGPNDRVQRSDRELLEEELDDREEGDNIKLEIELVYRAAPTAATQSEEQLNAYLFRCGGRVVARSRIEAVAYHALLAEVPVPVVREIVQLTPGGVASLDVVMAIRPQSLASSIEVQDGVGEAPPPAALPRDRPIVALVDGVPIGAHTLLRSHVVLDDQFGLEPTTPVFDRRHGTAMASLIIHGDRNNIGPVLPRRIHVVPVLGKGDRFPENRLPVDMIYTAVRRMCDGDEPTAPDVLIINVSLGNTRRPFQGQLSPWARLLDHLAYRYGLLFVVSAGNWAAPFPVRAFDTHTAYEDAEPARRAKETLRAIGDLVAERRLLSPAETINGLTVGASNEDAVTLAARRVARTIVDPYGTYAMSNPSSALGPGFARAVKPEVLLPGGREHLRFQASRAGYIDLRPAEPTRNAGLRVAAPPESGIESFEAHTSGTSAAAALASRTAHRIHDALEAAYGEEFTQLTKLQRAVLLKALVAHPARWPDETALLIREVIGPHDNKQHVRQKDNVRRFLGYGMVDAEDAVACATDRAVFWISGSLAPEKAAAVSVPVPSVIGGQARPHALAATLAWFAPTLPGRRSYRTVRLTLLEPNELGTLGVSAHKQQPDLNQVKRGTLLTRRWSGKKAAAIGVNGTVELTVQREPDQGGIVDEPVPFGLAVTLTMPGVVGLYEEVRARVELRQKAPG